jgi:hypothetical protein
MNSVKPWELEYEERFISDEDFIKSWVSFEPKDFFFALQEEEPGITLVYLVPKELFNYTGYLFWDSMPIVHLLPEYLVEIFESIYEADETQSNVMKDMISMGFIFSNRFQKLIDESNGIYGLVS